LFSKIKHIYIKADDGLSVIAYHFLKSFPYPLAVRSISRNKNINRNVLSVSRCYRDDFWCLLPDHKQSRRVFIGWFTMPVDVFGFRWKESPVIRWWRMPPPF